MLHGIWHLSKMQQPLVTVFGGSKLKQDNPWAIKAHQFAELLTSNNISVLTGGGPGIMQAINCGAIKSDKFINLGIGVKGLEKKNMCVQHYVNTKYFFTRKWLLTRYTSAFVAFPGGFGTFDEIAEIATLMESGKMPLAPIILIEKNYWGPLTDWLTNHSLKEGLINQKELSLFYVTDDLNEAFDLVCKHCRTINIK